MTKDRRMEKREVIYRHSGAVRITHWVNALVLLVLLMSGLQIFNAHPSALSRIEVDLRRSDNGHGADGGMATPSRASPLSSAGTSTPPACSASPPMPTATYDERGFPWSVTLPGHRNLSMGRRWHFFFAWLFLFNGLIYLAWSLGSGHLRRDLAPSGRRPQAYRQLRSASMRGSSSRKAKRPSATTCCRSSPISSSRSCFCR